MESAQSLLAGRRLVVVVQDLGVGGAEWQASLLARSLRRRTGAEVEVWCFSLFGRNRTLLQQSGIPILEISPGGEGGPFRRLVQTVRFVAAARRRRPELLIPFTDHPNKVCGAVWPLVGAMGSVWNQRDEGRQITGRPIERAALRLTTLFACNASSGESFLKERMGVPAHRIVRVYRFKDHATLLRSWRIVLDRKPKHAPVLLLAGRPGSEALILDRLARELNLGVQVRFLGEIDDVSGLLMTVDLVVHSSLREGCPNGVLEAMSAGVPVVATNIIGIREALGEAYPALVPGADETALAARIVQVLDEDGLRGSLKEQVLARFRNRFSPEQALAAYTSILESIIRGHTINAEAMARGRNRD